MALQCCVSVIHDGLGKYLIAQRRPDDSFGGYWEFPGGRQEEGETHEETCIREAGEEVGLSISVDRFLKTIENPYQGKEIHLHFYLCRVLNGKPQALECEAVRWAFPHELKQVLFPPANESIIEELITIHS